MEILKINQKIYKYSKADCLGRGAFGEVYLGKDQELGKEVAIKIIKIEDGTNEKEYEAEINIMISLMARIKPQQRRFFTELLDYQIDSKNKRIIIIMEYCNLKDLQNYLALNKELDEKKATSLIFQLVYALKCLKNLNIVHRDLKPSNILVHDEENSHKMQLKLTDFGCAIEGKGELKKSQENLINIMNSTVGTPLYMSPQLLKSENYTSKSDIWSLGILYYQMLFGRVPWQSKSYEEYKNLINQKPPIKFPKHINPISQKSQQFIQKCLEFEERDRYDWNEIFNHDLFKKHFYEFDNQQSSENDQSLTNKEESQENNSKNSKNNTNSNIESFTEKNIVVESKDLEKKEPTEVEGNNKPEMYPNFPLTNNEDCATTNNENDNAHKYKENKYLLDKNEEKQSTQSQYANSRINNDQIYYPPESSNTCDHYHNQSLKNPHQKTNKQMNDLQIGGSNNNKCKICSVF